jgi:(p)ppGpp synthase/HD superfamily hydrolase
MKMPNHLSERFLRGLDKAFTLHQGQLRKASQTPYFAHLMTVSALVLENGGSEDQAIAALLHDAVEDAGGLDTLVEIREEFGENVADLVDACTDSYTQPKPDWEPRKRDYLEKLKTASDDVLLISLADKIHNARSILRDLHLTGESTWEKFKGKKAGTLWYYQALANIFDEAPYPTLKNEFRNLVDEMHTLANLMENPS